VKRPRRRSLATAVRVAITSGLAATGWLLLGSTSAHAAEETASVIGGISAVEAGDTVASATAGSTPVVTITGSTLGAVQDPASIVRDPLGTVQSVTTPVTDTVDKVIGDAPVVGEVVPKGTVTTITGTTLGAVQDPASIVRDPLGTVRTVTTPVSEVVTPISGAIDKAVSTSPVVGGIVPPVKEASRLVPVAPSLPQPDLEVPAAATPRLTFPEQVPAAAQSAGDTAPAQNAPVTALDAAAAQAFSGEPATTARAPTKTTSTGAAPATFLLQIHPTPSMAAASPGWDRPSAVAGRGGATPSTAGSPTTNGGAPAPSGNNASSGGGSGTPCGTNASGWPETPAGTCYLELFPRLIAGNGNSFFDPVENPPTAPAFEPGSTPD
jgi:hypothetical protein